MTVELGPAWQGERAVLRSRAGMVAAQHQDAARVGAEVLAAGGNAVDAALATSLALAVVEPWMSGLGGGGLMLVAPGDGRDVELIDFAMVAPGALRVADYPLVPGEDDDLFGWPAVLEQRNILGPLAIAVPTQAAGLGLAHRRHGRMTWRELCQPALELARLGLPVTWPTTLRIATEARALARLPASRAVYLPDGLPPLPAADGAPAFLPLGRLADSLAELAASGPATLASGDLAAALVQDVQALGGVLALADLTGWQPTLGEVLPIPHGRAVVHAPGGLSAGPSLRLALAAIAGRIPAGAPTADSYLAWAEALDRSYEHRLAKMGAGAPAATCTTHLAVADRSGMMVSLTQTLLSVFGSKVVSPQTGILLNNGIMWFDPRPGRPNSLAPGRRPLANMCPVLATVAGQPWFALGASGGRKILPAVLQLTSLLIDGGLDLADAFATPRIDVSGGPELTADARLSDEILAELAAARPPVVARQRSVYPSHFACPSAVLREPASGLLVGMTDPVNPLGGLAAPA